MPDGVAVNTGSGLGVATDELLVTLTGTVAKTATSATLTGTSTLFLTELSVGMVISVPGTAVERRTISAIASDTSLTVSVALDNTASGQTASRVQHYQLVKIALGALDANDGPVSTTNPLPVAASATTVSATLTRPADTNVYAANDEISSSTSAPTILTFSDMARVSDGTGYITDAFCLNSQNAATKPQLELWLFDTTHTPDNDNAAFAPSDTEAGYVVAIIPLNQWFAGDDTAGATGNAIAVYAGPPISFKCVGSANLFGRVKLKNIITPLSAETYIFKLKVRRD